MKRLFNGGYESRFYLNHKWLLCQVSWQHNQLCFAGSKLGAPEALLQGQTPCLRQSCMNSAFLVKEEGKDTPCDLVWRGQCVLHTCMECLGNIKPAMVFLGVRDGKWWEPALFTNTVEARSWRRDLLFGRELLAKFGVVLQEFRK